MCSCECFETELSALLDGESNSQAAIAVLDHVARCPSCREFYRELRDFQEAVDRLPVLTPVARDVSAPAARCRPLPAQAELPTGLRGFDADDPAAPGSRAGTTRTPGRGSPGRSAPSWALGLAAVLVIAVVSYGILHLGTRGTVPDPAVNQNLTIQLEGKKGQMDRDRFVGLVKELLQADRQYQFKMLGILSSLPYSGPALEEPALLASVRGENARPRNRDQALAAAGKARIPD
jgi:hypothetical protein